MRPRSLRQRLALASARFKPTSAQVSWLWGSLKRTSSICTLSGGEASKAAAASCAQLSAWPLRSKGSWGAGRRSPGAWGRRPRSATPQNQQLLGPWACGGRITARCGARCSSARWPPPQASAAALLSWGLDPPSTAPRRGAAAGPLRSAPLQWPFAATHGTRIAG